MLTDFPCDPTVRLKAHCAVPVAGPVVGVAVIAAAPNSGWTSAVVNREQGAGNDLAGPPEFAGVAPPLGCDAVVVVTDGWLLDAPHATRPVAATTPSTRYRNLSIRRALSLVPVLRHPEGVGDPGSAQLGRAPC